MTRYIHARETGRNVPTGAQEHVFAIVRTLVSVLGLHCVRRRVRHRGQFGGNVRSALLALGCCVLINIGLSVNDRRVGPNDDAHQQFCGGTDDGPPSSACLLLATRFRRRRRRSAQAVGEDELDNSVNLAKYTHDTRCQIRHFVSARSSRTQARQTLSLIHI